MTCKPGLQSKTYVAWRRCGTTSLPYSAPAEECSGAVGVTDEEERLKIKSQEDFWAGLMFVAFGILAIVVARNYPMGSALRMGPGYFPTYLGAIMIVIGAIMTGRAYRIEGEGIGPWGWAATVVAVGCFCRLRPVDRKGGLRAGASGAHHRELACRPRYATAGASRADRSVDHGVRGPFHLRARIAVSAVPVELIWMRSPISFRIFISASA